MLRYLPNVYCTDSIKMGTKRVFSFQQKLSYLFLQDIRAVRLIFLVEWLFQLKVYTSLNIV